MIDLKGVPVRSFKKWYNRSISVNGVVSNVLKPLKPSHDSQASFSTSCPQMIYLFEKCSIQPFIFSLEREGGRRHLKRVEKKNNSAYTSSGVRSPSLSSGWSIGVNISIRSQWGQKSTARKERARRASIKRLFGHTPRRIPSRKIPVHSILRGSSVTFRCNGNRRNNKNEHSPGP